MKGTMSNEIIVPLPYLIPCPSLSSFLFPLLFSSLLPSLSLPLPPQDPKRHLEEKVDGILTSNITQSLGAMLDTVVFS